MGGNEEEEVRQALSVVLSDRMWGTNWDLGNFIWTQENTVFTVKVVKYWNRLYKEVVEHPSPEMLKTTTGKPAFCLPFLNKCDWTRQSQEVLSYSLPVLWYCEALQPSTVLLLTCCGADSLSSVAAVDSLEDTGAELYRQAISRNMDSLHTPVHTNTPNCF